jgi:NACHT domain
MPSQAELTTDLRAALAPSLQVLVPDLARVLSDVSSGVLTPAQVRARLSEPTTAELLRIVMAQAAPSSISVGNILNSNNVAIGNNFRAVFQGPGYPRPNYRSELDARLRYYGQVFLGREWLLAKLMQPKAPPPNAAVPYSLVLAPAGFGKSALAARLVQHAEAGTWPAPSPRLIYFFTRQDTAENKPAFYLQRVNAQLLNLLGYEGGVPSDLDMVRGQFSQLWSSAADQASAASPLVLLVDGLDEMAPGEVTLISLLPDYLPPNVRVIVTSRPNPDPRTLAVPGHPLRAAEEYPLQGFTVAEVQQLLVGAGLSAGEAAVLAPGVLQLTRGEPLFVRALAPEVAQAGAIPPALLDKPPAGVRVYFQRQLDLLWGSAKGNLARDVLGVLVVARAGLSQADLAGILGREPYEVEEVIGLIQRFLIGSERYELMHLELRKAVQEKFSAAPRAGYCQRLLGWCASYARQGWPAAAPAYVLQQYARHLEAEGRVDERHVLVTDPAFRAAQRDGLGDIETSLGDVRAALKTALERDEVVRAVQCVGAYRDTLRHGRLGDAVFAALDDGLFDDAFRRAAICGTDSDWAQVLWAYLAWDLAGQAQPALAQKALAAVSGAMAPPLNELYDALLLCTARRLAGSEGRSAEGWLGVWGRAADAAALLRLYPLATPIDRGAEQTRLDNLKQAAAGYADSAARQANPSGLYSEESNNEEDAARVAQLRQDLCHFAAEDDGRQIIEQLIGAILINPYPFYRNHGLTTLGVAALAAPEDAPGAPARQQRQLRAMLAGALYGEGVAFTFDLPATLLAWPHAASHEADELAELLGHGEQCLDRWGTYLRACSARAAASFRVDAAQRDTAADRLRDALRLPLGFAGFASAALLAQANRCLEMGLTPDQMQARPEGDLLGLPEAAAASAAFVRDPAFRARRVLLVHAYITEWLPQPTPAPAEVAARLDRMPDRDMRLAFIDHLSARWAVPGVSSGEANWPGLKALTLLALSDATTCDALLARLVAVRWRTLSPADIQALIAVGARDLATGRSWEYSAPATANDPGVVA